MVVAVVIIFGGIIAFNILKSYMIKQFFASYQPPAVSVSSTQAKKEKWKPSISAVGNFVASNGVDVSSQASGNVVAIHFDSGEFIQQDKPLIDIDDTVDEATLKFNQADLELQKINYQRQLDLSKRGATPSSMVDEAKAKLSQAQANVEKTQAVIRQKHITAPFSGRLGIRQIDLGEFISPGETKIVTLQSMDPLYLEFYLPEQLLNKLHINQKIVFSVEQNPNITFEGKINAINSKVDINTHNILVQATVPNCPAEALKNPEASSLVRVTQSAFNGKPLISCSSELNKENKVEEYSFIPGMFAAIEVSQPEVPDVIILPSTAISYSLYGDSVYLIKQRKSDSNDKNAKDDLYVTRVFVTTGDQKGNYTVIKKGVEAGQRVVSTGGLKLEDGTRVVINNQVKLQDTTSLDKIGQ